MSSLQGLWGAVWHQRLEDVHFGSKNPTSHRNAPSPPLGLASMIWEPGLSCQKRRKQKQLQVHVDTLYHWQARGSELSWAVSRWGEPGSREELLVCFAPRSSQIPLNGHWNCLGHRHPGRGRREEVARTQLLCPGGATIPGIT